MYRALDSTCLIETAETLHRRVSERFPDSGLCGACAELCEIASSSQKRSQWIERPQIALRIFVVTAIVVLITVFIILPVKIGAPEGISFLEFVASLEAGMNILVLIGAGVIFLITMENRIKRRGALRAIHELRSLAHVIDMHQLTKDPGRFLASEPTASSPKMELSPFLLTRYLDYCSEMLALIGKLAALYVQRFEDPVVITAATEIEDLTTGLSRKIWQKLMIVHQISGRNAKNDTSNLTV